MTFIFSNYANTTKEICAEIVQLYDSPQTEEEIIKTYGDFNSDEKINVFDFMRAKQHLLQDKEAEETSGGMRSDVADINNDGAFDFEDAFLLERYILKADTDFSYKFEDSYYTGNTANESDKKYAYAVFAENKGDALKIDSGNITINGKIGTNGEITGSLSEQNINGNFEFIETANISMMYMHDKISDTYFADEEAEVYYEDYIAEELNKSIDSPLIVYGSFENKATSAISSCLMATNDINISGDTTVENANNSVIYSKYGNIDISGENVSLNGLIYAPFGTVTIDSQTNLAIKGIVIAKEVNISADCVNMDVDPSMAEFIGVNTEEMIIPYTDWDYMNDENYDTVPDLVEEQIYTDPLSVDEQWLEENYGEEVTTEYIAEQKRELVEFLFMSKTLNIQNFKEISEVLLLAIKYGIPGLVKLNVELSKGQKTATLTIGETEVVLKPEETEPNPVYGPPPLLTHPVTYHDWVCYCYGKDYEDTPPAIYDDVTKKEKRVDIGTLLKMVAITEYMVAKDKAGEIIDDAKENIEDMFYSATTAATAFVFSATGIIDEALEGIRNLAVIKTASEIKEDVKNKLTSGINDLLGGAFDVKAVSTANGIEINIGKDFCLEVGCPMNADKMKDIKNWTIDAVFDDEKHDTEKIKNVIDTQTLGNIREVSETLYNDLLEMIIKDGESAESIIDIVDCINNDTEEFKKAYECFGDVKKAYECINDESGIHGEIIKENPNFTYYRNYKGQNLLITNESSKSIANKISKYLEKDIDSGDFIEAKVANHIKQNTNFSILKFSSEVYEVDLDTNLKKDPVGDFDVLTENYFIEVKKSILKVDINQIKKYIDPYEKNFFNFHNKNKKVIVYVDRKIEDEKKEQQWYKNLESSLKKMNVELVNSLDELLEVMK